jgi:pilus assembly protein CpaE
VASRDQIRLLVVEDVPQVAQYIRNLLNAQSLVKLLDVVPEGSRAAADVAELRPDVLVIDALLQGRVKASSILEQLRKDGLAVPVILLTVPQTPIKADPGKGVHGVLTMPFSGYDLLTMIQQVRSDFEAGSSEAASGIVAVFSPKGGVGKTTLAFNLAVALQHLGPRTVLIDGNLQFGDLRGLLKVPGDAASILELPTDRVAQSDLQRVLWRDPSGIDILMAPPRIEMAEMLSARDVEKVLSILRRVYPMIVVDLSPAINDVNLVFLDNATTILQVVTAESTTIRNVQAAAETFQAIGYAEGKVRYLLNRADSAGALPPNELERAIGRRPDYLVPSDGRLVVASNNEGVPFVLAQPDAAISKAIVNIAADLIGAGRAPAVASRR